MENKSELIEQLQSLIAIKILHAIALSFSFLYGPLTGLAWIIICLKNKKFEWDASTNTINFTALVVFLVLVWTKRLLDKKIETIKSKLAG
ncbi:MAG: hypothetical protein ACOYYF_11125 [Chloroflexota bacterium]|nr:hypothetical protein [Chloroflexota bacterium]MBI5702488.1 hypothetical protein [Chloroflexota bacterium]